ncbi:endolytic transglycosylase MltG [Natranaerobius trueperi]|uniref:Endolytic murein transglycosylase n=1 Tax=Natranaerobius trueperi TaxID=759412 RepID=A0A226BWP3_9FIRM|nr:endolytic transglycosylase MltG [Natranaerobius trueperi]OWZ83433.1 aminodeoxychorismate lyase [Natranaerobius trueperi]
MVQLIIRKKLQNTRDQLLVIGFLLMLGISGIYFYVVNALQPVEVDDTEIIIQSGTNMDEVSEILEEKEVVRNATIFRFYAIYNNYDGKIQAGEYLFTGKLSPDEILEKMIHGDVIDRSIRFTIPEGLRVDQVARRLEDQGLGDKEKYIELFSSDDWDYWFLEDFDEGVKFPVEGFLYPETYNVNADATEKEVVKKMLDQFDKMFTEKYERKMENRDVSVVDLMTLASIVEREAVRDDERERIAGVFYNRLENNMRLESCATVEYIIQENKPVLSYEDTQIESPYNTYRNNDLPPGPIASPSSSSIEAVLNPEEHEYLFFVSKLDGSGKHVFSKTYQEHEVQRTIQIQE